MEDSSPVEDSINSQIDRIILPNNEDLDWAQITYAFNYKRLLFISNYRTWLDFYSSNSENSKFNDYSPQELSHRFLHRVLANINDYCLTEDELHLLKLLDLHPGFQRNESGFVAVEQSENLSFPSYETVVELLMTNGDVLHETNFVAESVISNEQIVFDDFEGQQDVHRKFIFSEENTALLSVILSSDEDLPNCVVLPLEEMHKRLKAAKNRFELNGQQLENVNSSVEDLLKKLQVIKDLQTAISELVDKSNRK